MTANQAHKFVVNALSDCYPVTEANAISRRLLTDLFDISLTDMILHGDDLVVDADQVSDCADRLSKGEPVQYVVGFEEFYGQRFIVTPDVLIPRPETQEIIDFIIKNTNKNNKHTILDIGTGCGVIAITLAYELHKAQVSAMDISSEALEIAKKNALNIGADVQFILNDILTDSYSNKKYDIIVSNPPYVTESEKLLMRPNVLDYEPETALFVPDNDPLKFYKAIAVFALKSLTDNGKLYIEINEKFADEITNMLQILYFKNVMLCRDFNDKPRMICAEK